MLTIRLQRAGKRNQPEYRIVLAEKQDAASKKFIEVLGNYNPRTKDFAIKDQDRLKYWIEQHVELSPTVHNLFVTKNLITGAKRRAFRLVKKAVEAVPVSTAPVAAGAAPAPTSVSTPEPSVQSAFQPTSDNTSKNDNETAPVAATLTTETAQTSPAAKA